MDTEEYRKKIEKEVLEIIEERLKARKMNAERAREIARYILDTLKPQMSLNQIHQVVQQFDDHFPELVPVVIEVSNDYEQRIKSAVTEHVGNLLKQNKVDEANTVLKQALNKELKLQE